MHSFQRQAWVQNYQWLNQLFDSRKTTALNEICLNIAVFSKYYRIGVKSLTFYCDDECFTAKKVCQMGRLRNVRNYEIVNSCALHKSSTAWNKKFGSSWKIFVPNLNPKCALKKPAKKNLSGVAYYSWSKNSSVLEKTARRNHTSQLSMQRI